MPEEEDIIKELKENIDMEIKKANGTKQKINGVKNHIKKTLE